MAWVLRDADDDEDPRDAPFQEVQPLYTRPVAWPEDREAVLAGDPAALIAKLIRERDEEIAEHEAARSLVEEAGKVVERCQAVLAIMIKPDMTVSSMNAYTLCVEAEARSRSLLTKLKPEPQALSKAE